MFIAEEVRELLAQLGFRTLEEAVGHVECLDQDEAIKRWKSDGIDLSNVLMQPGPVPGTILHKTIDQNHELDKALDNKLIELAQPALDKKEPVRIEMPIRNVYRTLGTMLGYEITKRYGEEGLPDDTIDMTFHGAGGQSIGAFIPRGETIRVYGEVNDYAGRACPAAAWWSVRGRHHLRSARERDRRQCHRLRRDFRPNVRGRPRRRTFRRT